VTDEHILKLNAVELEEGLLRCVHASTDLMNRRRMYLKPPSAEAAGNDI
jgi:hypothetical protein